MAPRDQAGDPALEPLLDEDVDEKADRPRTPRLRSPWSVDSRALICVLFGAMLYPTWSWLAGSGLMIEGEPLKAGLEGVTKCQEPLAPSVTASRKSESPAESYTDLTDLWKNLSVEEAADIRNWLWHPHRGLNLTETSQAAENDNIIYLIEAQNPTKTAAIGYLEADGDVPSKYAHAVIHHGTEERIVDYLIGPLPISPATSMTPLTDIYHQPDIPYNAHGLGPNSTAMGKFMARTFGPLKDITIDLLGGYATGLKNDSLVGGGAAPLSYDGSWRRMWVQLKLNVPGHYLFPTDMFTYFDTSGTDSALWKVLRIVYYGQSFPTIEEFRNAWSNGTLKRSPKPDPKAIDWATRTRKGKGDGRDLDDRPGPRSVSFSGLRFRVDQEEQYVTWMGYSFYLGFQRDMGLNLWDIRFKGERIIYELSPQEAMAQYSGTDPHQATTVFLDRAFGMGAAVKELIVGYDCPAEAVYLPATVHTAEGSSTRLNGICVFERDSHKPLSRHTGWLKDEMGAIKGYELTVRSVSTVGNYDYIFDYTFQLDGTIEIRVSASGYLQGGVWRQGEDLYGHRIHDLAMGSLHDHVINYKVDFDIAGTRNSLIAAKLEMEEVTEPWVDEEWGHTFKQQRIVRTKIESENDSLLQYSKNMEGAYIIVNEEQHNSWGHARGYAIHPGASPIHLTNLDCKRTENNVNWAKHHLAVTRHHEHEPYSSSMWNIHLPGKPTVDFYKFFDGESLDQEDLVVWLNLGTHHIPRAEDSPQTLTNVATSYVLLTPFNYHDYDVSMDIRNAVILNAPEPGQAWSVDENQVAEPVCMPAKVPSLSYTGLVSFNDDGSRASSESVQSQRRIAESWHGLQAEM